MAQFDVFPNPSKHTAREMPYLLQGQSISHLQPILEVRGQPVVMLPAQVAAVPKRMLAAPVANLADARIDILAALDVLFSGV